MSMPTAEIADFLKRSIEPLPDSIYGERYRCAVHLLDGTCIPCVVFQSKKKNLQLFDRRMKELRWRPSQKEQVIGSFVAGGSRLAHYYIKDVEPSPFAWPLALLKEIHGETVMAWTAFVAEMRDGTLHSYGTSFNFEFFDLPDKYSYKDIEKIHSGMSYSPDGGLQKFSLEAMKKLLPLREKPFFTCYLDELT